MTENKLNPFEDENDEYVDGVDNDATDRHLACKQHELKTRTTHTDVSDHAPLSAPSLITCSSLLLLK